MTLAKARSALRKLANRKKAQTQRGFFKDTQDLFLGVPAARVRELAREFAHLPYADLKTLMKSRIHEEQSMARAILVRRFQKGNEASRAEVFQFYVRNRQFIDEWDGVDDSAPYIVGPYLLNRSKAALYRFAKSPSIWDRRIAIVSTWWFIRQGKIHETLKIARMLLGDGEDLIHKATGWMLREVGKCDIRALERFLRTHHRRMPRTTLRYAIERFPPKKRRAYLEGKF